MRHLLIGLNCMSHIRPRAESRCQPQNNQRRVSNLLNFPVAFRKSDRAALRTREGIIAEFCT